MSEDDPKMPSIPAPPLTPSLLDPSMAASGRETLPSLPPPVTSPSDPPPGMRSASVPPNLTAGLVVAGKYELRRKLGTGAMGEVWAARHRSLDEEVAIKLVMRGVDHEDGTSAESRFLLEARVAASLSRKTRHIVAVTDHGQDGALGYLVMELLAGESLDQRIHRTGPLPIAKVVPMISQVARALAIAHSEGVVHRDLKPSNVFVTSDEEGNALAKVLDFGIAKLRRTTDKRAAHSTRRGFLLGTPAYMSPEQARGKPIDHRTDVWALGVIAYHLLTGEFPFDGETGEELFARICRVEPIALHERLPDAPPVVNDFFVRAFATRLEDRFQSALALAGAFEQLEPLARGAKLSLPPAMELGIGDAEIAAVRLGARGVRSSSPPSKPSSKRPAASNSKGGAAELEPSMIAAGLPQRNGVWKALAAVALLGIVFAATGSVLSLYYEREPVKSAPVGIAVGVAVVEPTARAIPPPEPPTEKAAPLAAVASPQSLPAPPPVRAFAPAPRKLEPQPMSAIAPSNPPPTAATPALASPPPPKHPLDKGEVF